MSEKSLKDIDLAARVRRVSRPLPDAWEDQVIYFLMLDRFSDGQERDYRGNDGTMVNTGATPPFQPGDAGNVFSYDADR